MSAFVHEPFVGGYTDDFVAGWNACLARVTGAESPSPAYHSGWMACCAAAAADDGSFLKITPMEKPRDYPAPNPFRRYL